MYRSSTNSMRPVTKLIPITHSGGLLLKSYLSPPGPINFPHPQINIPDSIIILSPTNVPFRASFSPSRGLVPSMLRFFLRFFPVSGCSSRVLGARTATPLVKIFTYVIQYWPRIRASSGFFIHITSPRVAPCLFLLPYNKMPWNPRSLVLFISVTLGFQLALVHAIKFPTVKRAPNPPPSYFSFIKRDPESAFLTDEEVRNDPLFRFGDDLPLSDNASTLFHEALPRACKHIPGDKAWPSKITWDALNATVGGVLVRPSPIGKACYIDEGEYDASRCDTVKNSWSDSDLQ